MTRKQRATIKDVAKAAGVSAQTVSRVLNNRPDVAPETYRRIQEIIEEIGYAPNIHARSLSQGRSYTLGVVAYGLDYFGPSRVLTGIEQQANELGYSISLNLLHHPDTHNIDHMINDLLARQVAGIIWAVPSIGDNRDKVQASLKDAQVPVVLVSGMAEPISLPLVAIDNRAIGRQATEHLLAGGTQRVGIITGPPAWWESQQRQQGWGEALEASGLEVDDRCVVVGDWSPTSGEQGLYQLMDQNPETDAVFVSNDQMALGALHAAHRLNLRVPEDLSIVGVDNIPESAHFWPPLTSMRQRLREAGALSVQKLAQMISGAPQSYQDEFVSNVTLLKSELVIRESSRPTSG